MQQMADWLEKLGMSEYAKPFAENRIDFSVLPDLTDQDLEKLGVLLGDRRKILRAIAELAGAVAVSPQPALAEPKIQDTAERRQVTVMFCDLVGSTALSARMDLEDLREVISVYQKCVAETVRRFDGFVAKYMGDGVLAYFGYPQAHEDDAERAVRAGLELIAVVAGLKTRASLQTRVGIATGLVVVGDLIGSGEAQERGIVGETPNLAARLQGIAEPNRVVIAEGTRRLLGNLFELEHLGARDLKGIVGPVRAWAALRASSVEGRFEALHASGLTALVGREEELELLLRRWARAKTGEGQVVLLSGEAGIGKSRLTAALLERLATEPHTRLRYFCSPQHTDSALYPIISQMERAAGFAHDDTPQAKLDKLDAVLAQSFTPRQDAALFAEMLSLPNDERYPTFDLAPEQRRQRTMEALIAETEALTRQTPVLMIFEDAHWADPTSLELFGRAVDRIESLGVLLIVTFRPDFAPPWIGRPHVTALTINRLARRDIDAMIDRVVGNKLLPTSIRQDIIERTDGIPLFVEEMTKAVLEAESEGEARRTAATVPSPALAVPASLHASLMARLDRLGPAKEVAQIGAAIGREFSHAMLAAVVRKPEAELNSALDRLIAAGLLFRQGVPPHATYLFKHALVQDAAYGTLLREPRRALHARIAETLESQFAEIAESKPELLARHCTEAGLTDKAVGLWLKAGQQAVARSAMLEAEALLRRGLTLVSHLTDSISRQEHELDLLIALGRALSQTQGFHTQAAGEAYSRARQLCDQLRRPRKLVPILYGQWVNCFVGLESKRAEQFAAEMLKLGEVGDDTITRVVAYRVSGATNLFLGDFRAARAYLEQGLELYDPAQWAIYAELTSVDTRVALLGYLAQTLACCGYLDQARSRCDEGVAEARATSHAPTLAHILFVTWCVGWSAHAEPSTLLPYVDELLALSADRELVFWHNAGMASRGWCLAMSGRGEEGIALLTGGLSYHRATNFGPLFLTLLADACRTIGQPGAALAHLAGAAHQAEATSVRWCQCETLRMRGILLTLTGDRLGAEASFRDAIALAQQQSAKFFELRAALDLARHWRAQGKHDDAQDLLAPIYGWFTEGFDTLDLKEAKALLDGLAP
jgi:class 3 adenylate cyclase/tetratricopeptide (TPR) repeat protein